MTSIFQDNGVLCNDIPEGVVQHFVHCIETHGRHVPYLKYLQTIVKAENKYIKKCQDMVMAEVNFSNIILNVFCFSDIGFKLFLFSIYY